MEFNAYVYIIEFLRIIRYSVFQFFINLNSSAMIMLIK